MVFKKMAKKKPAPELPDATQVSKSSGVALAIEVKEANEPPRVTPTPIIEATFAFGQSFALLAAVELELFTWIGRGIHTASALAEKTHTSEQALTRLLRTLCAMKLLFYEEGQYQLTPVSARFLDKEMPTYLGDVAKQLRNECEAWLELTKVIQTGQSARKINKEPLGGHFFAEMVDHLFPIVHPVMNAVCKRLQIGIQTQGIRMLDLGSGNAPSAIAVLKHDQTARAVAMDFARVLEEAKIWAEKHGVQERISYEVADLETVELPSESYDLVFASHVFRILGPEVTQRLLAQSYQTLKSGGRLVVIETYNNPEYLVLFPNIVSLNMLVNTEAGNAFTIMEMKDWVTAAGFQLEVLSGLAPDPVIVATRP